MESINYSYLETAIGTLLVAGDASLRLIHFPIKKLKPEPGWNESRKGVVGDALKQLKEYFAGKRSDFDLPVAPAGTPFQQSVWRQLQGIPYGVTISYGELARRVGNPQASRAVGAANGQNPIPIVIPCHRVIGANGKLIGFGGGLPTKQTLLALEARQRSLL
jgi:methylated-DNA-[protein]-cysteine S-methyltransferase